MKKGSLMLWIFFFIVYAAMPAAAHSGGTDSKGGHWDRSTGVYHYHHGYGPHDHYDMDGDGDEDCPYTFDERVIGITNTSDAYDKGYSQGKRDGYTSGYESGYSQGKTDMKEEMLQNLEAAEKEAAKNAYLASALYGIPAVCFVSSWFSRKSRREEKQQKASEQTNVTVAKAKQDSITAPKVVSRNCDSSAFSFIDYQNSVLILVFSSGQEYHYYNVPKYIYDDLLNAPSKGKYYHTRIKDKYPYY